MKDKLPFEEELAQKLQDLPLPDAESSWQGMKQLLEKEKKGRRPLPPFLLHGCLSGVLLFGAFLGIWWFTWKSEPAHKSHLEQTGSTAVRPAPNPPLSGAYRGSHGRTTGAHRLNKEPVRQAIKKDRLPDPTSPSGGKPAISAPVNRPAAHESGTMQSISAGNGGKKIRRPVKESIANGGRKRTNAPRGRSQQGANTPTTHPQQAITAATDTTVDKKAAEPSPRRQTEKEAGADTTKAGKGEKGGAPGDSTRKKMARTQKRYFSAGLSLNQQIPVAGQKATPYSSAGRKASLGDYVPAVYARLHGGNQWAIQSEFRYGAPQYAKEFTYSTTRLDSFGTSVTRQYLTLKKTFYHQLYLSYHRMLRPNWSVGGGVLYSRFGGAVSEQEIRKMHVNGTTEDILSKKLVAVPSRTDSFFTRSQVHLLLETEYRHKSFAAGVRYTQGLQPFIHYTTTTGKAQKEVSHALQLFIRLRIWQQKG